MAKTLAKPSATNTIQSPSAEVALAIKRTLAYAAVFGADLTARLTWRWLLSEQLIDWSTFQKVRHRLDVSPLHLRQNRSRSNLPDQQSVEKSAVAHSLWWEVAQAISALHWIPWIDSIWVTGSVAAGSPRPADDVDLLIITVPQRLWLTRLLVVGVAAARGRYRWFGQSPLAARGRWCCNLWLEPSALTMPTERQSLYSARELIQAVPVYARRRDSADQLLQANPWVKRYSANGYFLARRRAQSVGRSGQTLRHTSSSYIFDYLNQLAWQCQWRWMRHRRTRETIAMDRAFFHPRDTQTWVLTQYETICRQQGISPWYGFISTKLSKRLSSRRSGPKRSGLTG